MTSPSPPSVATSYTTDNGTAVPSANVLDVRAVDVTDNNNNGIQTEGGLVETGASNRIQVQLTNRITATVTTTDDSTTTIGTFSLGAVPGVFTFDGYYSGFITSAPSNAGGSYFCNASARTDGATATEIGQDIDTIFEDVTMTDSDVFFTVSGNNVVFQVKGLVGTTINWRIKFEYTLVS